MRFVADRIRLPEWVIGAAALALGLDTVLASWFGSQTGWQALSVTRYLIALSCLAGLATWFLQGTRRSPAIPICATVVTFFVSMVLTLVLVWRVPVDPPGRASAAVGGYLGLALALVLAAGAYRSMRLDGIREADGPAEIELLALGSAPSRPDPAL